MTISIVFADSYKMDKSTDSMKMTELPIFGPNENDAKKPDKFALLVICKHPDEQETPKGMADDAQLMENTLIKLGWKVRCMGLGVHISEDSILEEIRRFDLSSCSRFIIYFNCWINHEGLLILNQCSTLNYTTFATTVASIEKLRDVPFLFMFDIRWLNNQCSKILPPPVIDSINDDKSRQSYETIPKFQVVFLRPTHLCTVVPLRVPSIAWKSVRVLMVWPTPLRGLDLLSPH